MNKSLQSPYDLPKGKLKEYKSLREAVINSGRQYNNQYNSFAPWRCQLDTPEKKDAIQFILGDMLEVTDLNYESSVIIFNLGDIETKTDLNFREFKLLQQVIQNAKFSGRENHIRLAKSMMALNEDGQRLIELESQSKMFAEDFQKCGNAYNKFCESNRVMPENIDMEIEKLENAGMKPEDIPNTGNGNVVDMNGNKTDK